MADAMPGLVSYVDADMRYQYLNRAYRDWFGLDPEALVGKTPLEVSGPDGFKSFERHLRRALGGEQVVYEEIVKFQHGGTRTVRGYFVPDHGGDGAVHGIFSFTTDITRERASEEALRRAHRDAV